MAPSPNHQLELDLSKYEKLDALQAGHIRHFHNLVSLPDGEWHHMSAEESQQEFVDALRYQIAHMTYATAIAHYHRLPAARSIFKPLFRRLIHKMLHPNVWSYWYLTSQSGKFTDPGRTELRKPWANPVVTENIMYSGHLLLMTSLYAMLFDDDEFEKPKSLTFKWSPLFWGLGPEQFSYDNRSLQAAILAEMERENWVGVCCEPNNVFLVCNQFPIIAIRQNDIRDGTNIVDGVLEKYKTALEKNKMIRDDGFYADWLYVRQGYTQSPKDVGFLAWTNAFMNAWNSEFVHSSYEKQALGFLTNINGQVQLQDAAVGWEYRRIAEKEGKGPNDADALVEARTEASKKAPSPFPYKRSTLGYVAQWLSELGKDTELQGILADTHERLNPTWEKGGLFYPRNDTRTNEKGENIHMDPFTGNTAIGYGRLNVPDGQKIMWEKPWTRQYLETQPWIDGVQLSDGVDCLRSLWDADANALILTLKTWSDKPLTVKPIAKNLAAGTWAVYVQGQLVETDTVPGSGNFAIEVTVDGNALDIVFVKVE